MPISVQSIGMVGCSPRVWKVVASLICAAVLIAGSAARSFAGINENATLDEWAALSGTGPGGGNVTLLGTIRNSGTHGSLSVAVGGYADGRYTVSAVTVSTGTEIEVGTLTVRGTRRTGGSATFGSARSPFPMGLSPFDIATISLSDSNGNVVSTGTLSPVPSGYYNALSPFLPSTSKENGYAMIRAFGACPAAAVTTGSSPTSDQDAGASGGVDAVVQMGNGNYYSGNTLVVNGSTQSWVINPSGVSPTGVITGTSPSSLILTPTNGSGVLYIGGIGFVVPPGGNLSAGTTASSPTLTLSGSPTTTSGTLALPPSLTLNPSPTPVPVIDEGGDEGGTLNLADGASEGGLSGFSLGAPTLYIDGGLYSASLADTGADNEILTLSLAEYSGTIVYGNGNVVFGPNVTISSTFNGTINLSDTTSYTGDFLIQSGLPVLLSGPGNTDGATLVSGTFSVCTADASPAASATPSASATPVPTDDTSGGGMTTQMRKAAVKVKVAPVTGEITIHAHGLPANAPVIYVTDTGVTATADTDLHGNLTVTAFQGGATGSLPGTLDLYSIKWIAIEDTSGTVLMTAAF